jgi:hypothetical protein
VGSVKLLVLGVGRTAGATNVYPEFPVVENGHQICPTRLPAVTRRERKVATIVEAATAALGPLAGEPLQGRCGLVLATRWDGRLTTLVDETTSTLRSCVDLSPSTMALTLVPHVATACVPMVLGIAGPTMTIASRRGLSDAIDLAAGYLRHGVPLMLAQESELALPTHLRDAESGAAEDMSISLLLGLEDFGRPVLAQIDR